MADTTAAAGKATVCFYRGNSLSSLVVRWDTQRPGQSLADVPAHTAIVLTVGGVQMLYEFVSTGFSSRLAIMSDFAWSETVDLLNQPQAVSFAWGCRGERYGWLTILDIALARLVPDRWLAFYKRRCKRICSLFVLQCLGAGGWDAPTWADRQYTIMSPNDVLWALKKTEATLG